MVRAIKLIFAGLVCLMLLPGVARAEETPVEKARGAFEKGEYTQAIEILKSAEVVELNNGGVYVLLARSYLELDQYDAAVNSAEKAVAIDPKNSDYHRWLGEAYGAKAAHASMLSAYSLARKTQKEFDAAVQLDAHNNDAQQDLIEYDCTAPGMVGGGEEKAQPLIEKLMKMDAAEGHYATGICRAQKKDYAAADTEFAKALENKPKTAKRIYDIGDYFLQRKNAEKLLVVAGAGEEISPQDPRGKFYRGVALILQTQKPAEAEKLLREYLQLAPMNSEYPRPWASHYWLGRLQESLKNPAGARGEYQAALKLNGKYKPAQEALKQLGKD
ncbi:MAG TPA: tetratricopeptide repeat protein [Candidatus Acidoferrum sp.]|jgi:tetratricopeptide (TPR) repeat protein|nr:tetratricopeptide repeat protein [Candidatus Acidoferrum sp.]